MIIYTTGDLLQSDAEMLVNTVNCEGYMGKGIAYQFKLQYPENNLNYVKACKIGELRVGKLHYSKERDKIIVNFPTKDKWRAKSKIEYIENGLNELIKLIEFLKVKSIAIPPLGSGNGGLIWSEVKELIESKLLTLNDNIEIYIYEPSNNYFARPNVEPKLSLSALILLEIKRHLNKFDTLRLQKTAYFIDVFSEQKYFHFKKNKHGSYENYISLISKGIKEFQIYHNVKDNDEAYRILYNKIVSKSIEMKLIQLLPLIEKASDCVNSIGTNHELECISTVIYKLDEHKILSDDEILKLIKAGSEDSAKRFSDEDISNAISLLYQSNILQKTLMGYTIDRS